MFRCRRKLRWALSMVGVLGLGLWATSGSAARVQDAEAFGMVGTYDVVMDVAGGLTEYATFRIETFNAKTGAFRGHGNLESFGAFAFSGTVTGSSIVMRAGLTGVTRYRGTIRPGGKISGTMTDSADERGTWTMTRLTTSAIPPVVVEKTGWGEAPPRQYLGGSYSWGVEVVNHSTTLDAMDVDVTVHVQARGVGELPAGDYTITVLPAGQSFVIGGGGGALGGQVTRVTAAVYVQSLQAKRYRLPTVSNLHIYRKKSFVIAQVTNPYSTAINLLQANFYAVVFDSAGRIIGGGGFTPGVSGPSKLKPGRHTEVAIGINSPMSRAASAEISVNP